MGNPQPVFVKVHALQGPIRSLSNPQSLGLQFSRYLLHAVTFQIAATLKQFHSMFLEACD